MMSNKYLRDKKGRFIKGTPQPCGYGKGKQTEPWNKNLTKDIDDRVKAYSDKKRGIRTSPNTEFGKLDKHPYWHGGRSYKDYSTEFNEELKELIRNRDNHICQECGVEEDRLGYNLHVHHIDYNKKNNNESNLISLCKSCHAQTNYTRDNWCEYLQEKIERGE